MPRRSTINEPTKASTLNLSLPAGACCALPPGLFNRRPPTTLRSLFLLILIPRVRTPFLRQARGPAIIFKAGFPFWFWCRRAYTHLSIKVAPCSDLSFPTFLLVLKIVVAHCRRYYELSFSETASLGDFVVPVLPKLTGLTASGPIEP